MSLSADGVDLVAAVFGARGTGKSTEIKTWLARAKPARVMLWDTMDEYGAYLPRVDRLEEFLDQAAPLGRYVPTGEGKIWRERFDVFCSIAYELGDLVMVVEEGQRVTSPGRSPAAWSDCTLRGRHKRLRVVMLSQRPASVDKDLFSNATVIRTGRLNFADDVACMAGVLMRQAEEIATLPPFEYLQRDTLTGEVTRGRVEAPAPTLAIAVASTAARSSSPPAAHTRRRRKKKVARPARARGARL